MTRTNRLSKKKAIRRSKSVKKTRKLPSEQTEALAQDTDSRILPLMTTVGIRPNNTSFSPASSS